MSRDLRPTVKEALEEDILYPFFAVEMQFDNDQTLRIWTGTGILNYQGNEWFGAGELLTISAIEETSELVASGAQIGLSAIPPEVISLALSEPYQGRACKIFLGTFNKTDSLSTPTNTLILLNNGSQIDLGDNRTELTEVFSGFMDQMPIEEGPDNTIISLSVENKLINLEKPKNTRYTSTWQKSRFPNDLGLDFIEDLQDKEIFWGTKNA